MRLTRIEATRFGRLHDVSLGPLGEGLTVVLGPNEAGKSSLTALVRYLLYGFPTEKSGTDRPYLSDAGTREGRLVFESAAGEWVIERTAGPKGGPSSVRALRGPELPGLIDELTGGVSEQAFKVVFGFGLAEMAEIERMRGSGDSIIAQLYAAGAGLTVSPQEVRAAIDADANVLYRPKGSKPFVNALIGQARELRSQITALEQDAVRLSADRERLDELAIELADALTQRDAQAALHRRLAENARVLADFERTVRDTEEQLVLLRRTAREAAERAASITVDERVLEASAEIEVLAADLSAFRKSLGEVRELESQVQGRSAQIAARLAEAGLDTTAAARVDITPQTRAGVERWRDTLLTTEERSRAAAAERDARADEAAVAAGHVPAGATVPAAPVSAFDLAAWIVVAVAGAVLAGFGGLAGQWALAGGGAVLTVFAAAMFVRARARGRVALPQSDSVRLAERAAESARRAGEAVMAAERATREVDAAREEWQAFRVKRGLDAVTEPAAVARVLDLVAEARRIDGEREELAARLSAEERAIAAYTERVSVLAARLSAVPPAQAAEAPATVEGLKELMARARDAARDGENAARDAQSAASAVIETEARQAHATVQAQGLIERLGVSGGLAELGAAVNRAELESAAAQERCDNLQREHASLEARIGEREREDTMGALRLELAGLSERTSAHAERYAVLAVAARLLQLAQDRYERERQPVVVRDAQRIFATITAGEYPRLTVPLGASAIEVFDASARAKDTARLSTGTAEQLYLALRLALIGQLGARGAALPVLMDDVFANFDPERRAGAAAAVAELAAARQVVVFTCHPETAALFEERASGVTTLTLDRC